MDRTTGPDRHSTHLPRLRATASPYSQAGVWCAAALFYIALTLVHTWPLARHLTDRLPHDPGDPALNAWLLWWNATVRPLSEAWWNGLGFWPTQGTHRLLRASARPGVADVADHLGRRHAGARVQRRLSRVVRLSALGAHVLVWRLTGRHDGGLVAGLAFGFATVRAGHLSHLQVLTTYWMPVALLALHVFWQTRRARWLVVFALAWLFQALSNNYYALFLSVLVGLWLVWFGLTRAALGRLAAAVASARHCRLLPLPARVGLSGHARRAWPAARPRRSGHLQRRPGRVPQRTTPVVGLGLAANGNVAGARAVRWA